MIDEDQLRSIAGSTADIVLSILLDFSEDGSKLLAQATDAISQEDFTTAAGLYHQLSGSAGTLGLSRLHLTLKELQTQCNEGNPSQKTGNLESIFDQSVEAAKQFLLDLSSNPEGAIETT